MSSGLQEWQWCVDVSEGLLDSPLLSPPAREVCKSGLWESMDTPHADDGWILSVRLPMTALASDSLSRSWCQPSQTNAKYIPARGGKKKSKEEGGEQQNIERCWDRIEQNDRREKRNNIRKQKKLLEICCLQAERKHVVKGHLGKEPQQTAQPKCQPWMGESWIVMVLHSRLLHWDLKSAITAQQRPEPEELWQVHALMPTLRSKANCTPWQVIWNSCEEFCVINCREIEIGETGNQAKS